MTSIRQGRGSRLGVPLCAVTALAFALAGCGGGSSSGASTAQSSTSTQQSASAQGSAAGSTGTQGSTSTQSPSSGATGSSGSTPATSSHSVTLNWLPPTENVDGTPLTNLAGYNIHYGTASGQLTQTISISNPGLATYVVSNLPAGTYYFAVSAVNAAGTESPLSPEVETTVN